MSSTPYRLTAENQRILDALYPVATFATVRAIVANYNAARQIEALMNAAREEGRRAGQLCVGAATSPAPRLVDVTLKNGACFRVPASDSPSIWPTSRDVEKITDAETGETLWPPLSFCDNCGSDKVEFPVTSPGPRFCAKCIEALR